MTIVRWLEDLALIVVVFASVFYAANLLDHVLGRLLK
jgi:hypothetical protein